MAKNTAVQVHEYGQSPWYDNISREILFNGQLKRLIDECGIRGLTSNPSIFDKALASVDAYDGQILSLSSKNLSTDELFEELAVQDIALAADLLLPVYRSSNGDDGFVSIEVSPLLARDSEKTIVEAKRLFARLARPNIMIKIPGTAQGLPAIEQALINGINVNITLLFSVENYVQVANTYCRALRERLRQGLAIDKIRSVASFFVSRVDSIVDKSLERIVEEKKDKDQAGAKLLQSLKGKFGVINSRLAYQEFEKIFLSEQFSDLRQSGGAVQRPLWASTSTKNPSYRDVLYVEELIGKHTVNTLPHATLEAFIDHGVLAETISKDLHEASPFAKQLACVGVPIDALLEQLQIEGVEAFAASFRALNQTLAKKQSMPL